MGTGQKEHKGIDKMSGIYLFNFFFFNLQEIAYSQPPSKPIRRKFRPENQATENQEPSTTVSGPAPVATVKTHPAVQK